MPELRADELQKAKLPVMLHFHGGAYCATQFDWYMYYAFYTRLARTTRAIIVSIKLRLAPEHRIPAACDDGYDALLWLCSLARGESHEPCLGAHADFGRTFLVGDSSGGSILHQVAARAAQEQWGPLKLVGCISIQPGFHRSKHSKSEREVQFESPILTLEMIDKFMGFALPEGKDHPVICPMGPYAPPRLDGLRLPPFMVAVAQNDLLRDTEMEYCQALKEAGKDVEVVFSEGVGHIFYLNKIGVDMDPHIGAQTDMLISAITDFVKRH